MANVAPGPATANVPKRTAREPFRSMSAITRPASINTKLTQAAHSNKRACLVGDMGDDATSSQLSHHPEGRHTRLSEIRHARGEGRSRAADDGLTAVSCPPARLSTWSLVRDNRAVLEITWLLTTLAQSSAALIAIIGGLLVTRYVSLHAQQRAAGRRVADLTRRRGLALERLRTAQDVFEHFSVEVTAHDQNVYRRLLRLPADVEADQIPVTLLEAVPQAAGMGQERLRQRLVVMRRELERALKQFDERIPPARMQEPWREVNELLDYPRQEEHLWAWAYMALFRQRDRKARSRRARLQPRAGADLDWEEAYEAQWEIAEHEVLQRRVDKVEAEARSLEQELHLAQETFEASRQPEGFRLALQVLSTFVALGIAVPVLMLAFWPAEVALGLDLGIRAVALAFFFTGLGLVLRFLFRYSTFLRGDEERLPESLWQLIKPRQLGGGGGRR